MYTRNILNKILQVINILLLITGVFWFFGGIYIVISTILYNSNDLQMLKEELYSYGVLPLFAITGGVIAIAMFANSWICDANFYSGYFEGDLDGRVDIKELAPLMGKPVWVVKMQLTLFRLVYMKGFKLNKNRNSTEAILGSKKIICQCNECGGELERSAYYTGKCGYCGGIDLHAKVISGNTFYSIDNKVKEGYGNPEFYRVKRIFGKKILALLMLSVGLLLVMVAIMGFADSLNNGLKNNDIELLDTAATFGTLLVGCLPIIFNGIKRLEYVHVARESSEYFAGRKTPYVKLDSIPYIKKGRNRNRRIRVLRRTLRKRYLRNCNYEIHDDKLMLVLSKRIVKNKCPHCGGAINMPVDEHYKCQYCDKIIMHVIKSK